MIVKLLTEHHFKFLSLKGGYGGSSESTLVKMSNCWKSHAVAMLNSTSASGGSDAVGISFNKRALSFETATEKKVSEYDQEIPPSLSNVYCTISQSTTTN